MTRFALGEHELAFSELREAIENNPRLRAAAESDELLAPLRKGPDWLDATS